MKKVPNLLVTFEFRSYGRTHEEVIDRLKEVGEDTPEFFAFRGMRVV